MAVSKLMNENEDLIKSAITDGISAEVIDSILENAIEKSDKLGYMPSQFTKIIEIIGNMKKNVKNKVNCSYVSDFVKNNNEKIMAALTEGINSEEVAIDLINSIDNEDNDLRFHTKLVSEIKKKQLKLNNEKVTKLESKYQKVKN